MTSPAALAAMDRFAALLEAAGRKVIRRCAESFHFQCPLHDDHTPSASARVGDRGVSVVAYCQVCLGAASLPTMLEALGANDADRTLILRGMTAARGNGAGEILHHDYRKADGSPVLRVTRRLDAFGKTAIKPDGKRDIWRQYFHGGAWCWPKDVPESAKPDTRDLLYNLSAVLEAARQGRTVHVVEGERCADALIELGLVATTNCGGAGKWTRGHSEQLLGVERIVIEEDNDATGRAHAEKVATSAAAAGIPKIEICRFRDLPEHADAWDWLVLQKGSGKTNKQVRDELQARAEPCTPLLSSVERSSSHTRPRYKLTRLSTIEEQSLSWLWLHRIPLGMVTLLAGDGGQGKSTIALDVAARLTRGLPMPDGTPGAEPAGVIVFSSEDNLASVVKPRLRLAGADMERVATLKLETPQGDDRELAITPEDLAQLEQAVAEIAARFVVLDPLVAYSDDALNLHHNADARRLMARLHGTTERLGIAVLGIHHFNRPGQHVGAAHRFTGSTGLLNAARSGLVVGPDPDDSTGERMILALAKPNLAPRSTPSLAYRLDVPQGSEHPRVEWLGESSVNANQLVAVPSSPEERSALDEAIGFLRDRLAQGPAKVEDLYRDAHRARISDRTLERAKERLGVRGERKGGIAGDGWWEWALPPLPSHLAAIGTSHRKQTVPPIAANGVDGRETAPALERQVDRIADFLDGGRP